MLSDVGFVGHQNNRIPLVMKLLKQSHDLLARLGVEVSRRFISKNNGRACDKRPSDSNSLTLTTGKLVGFVVNAITQPDMIQGLECALFSLSGAVPAVDQRQFYVVKRIRTRQQIERLETQTRFPCSGPWPDRCRPSH